MADWFDSSNLPASIRGRTNATVAGRSSDDAAIRAWTKMAEKRQAFVNAGLPTRKAPPITGGDVTHKPTSIYNQAYDGPGYASAPNSYGVFSLAAPLLRGVDTVMKPIYYLQNKKPVPKPGNPKKQNMFTEWADTLNPPYVPKTIPGIENIKNSSNIPNIQYHGPEQLAGLLPGLISRNLAKK